MDESMDPRVVEHARILARWSTDIKRGEMVIVRASPESHELALALTREATKLGARVMVVMESDELNKAFFDAADDQTIALLPKHMMAAMKEADVYIGLGAPLNTMTLASVDPKKQIALAKANQPLSELVLSKRWCGTVHPCRSLAQQANMSLEEYQDFVYNAVIIDWAAESKNWFLLKDHLERHKDIRFVGPETDIHAETGGRIWIASDGRKNMPSGEVFTAPIEDSVEGKIYFDIPFLYQGKVIEGVRLSFEKGFVVDYSAEKEQPTLKAVLEVDEGARRLGEMAIGTNRGIKRYTLNMLFDEKIGDTIHCALGRAYKECNGLNESAVHVDMVKSMARGKITAGNEVIYHAGKFFYDK